MIGSDLVDEPSVESPIFSRVFRAGWLSVGLVLPFTETRSAETSAQQQLDYASLADQLGFAALWVRDVPLNSDDYPDPQAHLDPWVFLGGLAARTQRIALGTAAIAAPVRHPLHIAKGAVSVDVASQGRFILGLGSGDRPPEYLAFGRDIEQGGELYRDVWTRIQTTITNPARVVLDVSNPPTTTFQLRPYAVTGAIPLIAVGSSHQSLGWIARNALAWVTYYRPHDIQKDRFKLWRDAVDRLKPERFRGLGQSFQLELVDNQVAGPVELPLGLRLGAKAFVQELRGLRSIGAHHVLLNLNGTGRPVEEVLEELARDVIPHIND